ncbi:MAG: ABC transporter permease [Lachnospiraceae bacterium]|nr:ABC transporter permease [Lachnospiraceae bacterium]
MKGKNIRAIIRDHIMYLVLLALVAMFTVATGGTFLKPQNVINVVNQNVYLLVVGVGITFIMLSGGLDLSIGYQISTIAVVMGILSRDGAPTAAIMAAGFALGICLGTLNGLIYARLKVFPFMITLAIQYILNGVTYLLSNSKTFRTFDGAFKFLGGYTFALKLGGGSVNFPFGIIVMAAAILAGAFILNKTYFGRHIYAMGSNPEAVVLSGVNLAKMRVFVFALAGVFVSLGAILAAGRIGATSSGTGIGAEFTVMAGAMLGGVKMGGGGGKMNNMVVGMLIIGLLNNGMNLMNLNQYWQYVAMGIVLLLAISLDTLQTESADKRAKQVPPPTGA